MCDVALAPCSAYAAGVGLNLLCPPGDMPTDVRADYEAMLRWAYELSVADASVGGFKSQAVRDLSPVFVAGLQRAFAEFTQPFLEVLQSHLLNDAATTEKARGHRQRRVLELLLSFLPPELVDDHYFQLGSVETCGGWMLVNGPPSARANIDLLAVACAMPKLVIGCLACFLDRVDVKTLRRAPDLFARDPAMLQCLPRLRRDLEFARHFVRHHPDKLSQLSDSVREDPEVVRFVADDLLLWGRGDEAYVEALRQAAYALAGAVGAPSKLSSRQRQAVRRLGDVLADPSECPDPMLLPAATGVVRRFSKRLQLEDAASAPPPPPATPALSPRLRPDPAPAPPTPCELEVRRANEAALAEKRAARQRQAPKAAAHKVVGRKAPGKPQERGSPELEQAVQSPARGGKPSAREVREAQRERPPLVLVEHVLEAAEDDVFRRAEIAIVRKLKTERRLLKKQTAAAARGVAKAKAAELFGV